MASRRSVRVRPGVTNRHSSYSTTGSAMANPVNTDTLSRTMKGSMTDWTTSVSHGMGGLLCAGRAWHASR